MLLRCEKAIEDVEVNVEYDVALKVVVRPRASQTSDLRLLREVGEVLSLPRWADRCSGRLLTALQKIVVAMVMRARVLLSVERDLEEAVSLR